MTSNINQRLTHPTGILITFLASIVSIGVSSALYHFKYSQNPMPDHPESTIWFFCLILILLLRHQFRVVFVDSSAAVHVPPGRLRFSLWLLVPLAVMGSSSLMVFSYDAFLGTQWMMIYSIVFSIFWILLISGVRRDYLNQLETQATGGDLQAVSQIKAIKRRRINGAIGVFSDIVILLFWALYNPEQGLDEGMITLAMLSVGIAFYEFGRLYQEPLLERLSYCFTVLKKDYLSA